MRVRVYRTVLWRCWLGDMEEHPVCKKLRVGMLMVMILPKLCTSYSSSCHHHAPPSSSAPTKSRTDALTQLSCHWYSNQHNDAFGVAWVRLAFGHHCHLWFHAFIAKNAKTFPVCIQQKKITKHRCKFSVNCIKIVSIGSHETPSPDAREFTSTMRQFRFRLGLRTRPC